MEIERSQFGSRFQVGVESNGREMHWGQMQSLRGNERESLMSCEKI